MEGECSREDGFGPVEPRQKTADKEIRHFSRVSIEHQHLSNLTTARSTADTNCMVPKL